MIDPKKIRSSNRVWWLIFVIAFIFLCGLYIPTLMAAQPTNQDNQNKKKIASFLLRDGCESVLIGSSMLERVKEGYFDDSKFCNLSIPGGSSIDGASILENLGTGKTPKLILIEINAIRPLNKEYAEMASTRPILLRTLKLKNALKAIDPNFSIDQKETPPILSSSDKRKLLEKGPSNSTGLRDNQEKNRDASLAKDVDFEPKYLTAAIEGYRPLIIFSQAMERAGAKVFFIYLPKPSKGAVNPLSIIDSEYPGHTLRFELPYRELRWEDDTHLDDRSALIYAVELQKALKITPPLKK